LEDIQESIQLYGPTLFPDTLRNDEEAQIEQQSFESSSSSDLQLSNESVLPYRANLVLSQATASQQSSQNKEVSNRQENESDEEEEPQLSDAAINALRRMLALKGKGSNRRIGTRLTTNLLISSSSSQHFSLPTEVYPVVPINMFSPAGTSSIQLSPMNPSLPVATVRPQQNKNSHSNKGAPRRVQINPSSTHISSRTPRIFVKNTGG
jgi:hypothetical protein